MRPTRVLAAILVFLVVLAFVPAADSIRFKISAASFLKPALSFSKNISQGLVDLFYFHRNARQLKVLQNERAKQGFTEFRYRELELENQRLSRLLDIKSKTATSAKAGIPSRVIGRSVNSWNRACLIDKGSRHGIRVNMAVLSEYSLVGKVIEAGPSVSKVLFITDPSSKVGVVIARTRQHGVLYGAGSGDCRIKYLSLESEIKPGDAVLTAGFGAFFPKGLPIGSLTKAWKEPGQIYQVAEIKPLTDLSTIEEVICVQ